DWSSDVCSSDLAVHSLSDFHLCPGVYAGSSLVQYKNWRIAEKDSRYSQQLSLSHGNVLRFILQHRIISLRQCPYKEIHSGCFGSGNDFFSGSVRFSVSNILCNGSLKKPGILKDHAEIFSQVSSCEISGIHSLQ